MFYVCSKYICEDTQIRNGNLLLDLTSNGTPTSSLSCNWEWAVAVNIVIFYPDEVGGVRWNVLSPFTSWHTGIFRKQ